MIQLRDSQDIAFLSALLGTAQPQLVFIILCIPELRPARGNKVRQCGFESHNHSPPTPVWFSCNFLKICLSHPGKVPRRIFQYSYWPNLEGRFVGPFLTDD